MRSRHILGALVLLLSSLVIGLAEKKPPPTVAGVSFEGNHVYDAGRLEDLMVTRGPGLFHSTDFHQEVLDDDLVNLINFYHQNGYLQAHVVETRTKADTAEHTIEILVRLHEGALTKVRSLNIDGNRAFQNDVLLDMVGLKPGDALLGKTIQDGMFSMATLYADSGYLNAAIQPAITVDSMALLADVRFHVEERTQSRISGIEISGIAKTQENIVRRELLFEEGEVVHYSLLLESQRNLYLTGLFESVFVRPDSSADSTMKVIRVELKEKLSGEFNLTAGYGSVEKVRGKVQLMTANFRGTGRQLGMTLSASFIQQGVEGSFSEPWTLGTRWRTDINIFAEFQQEPSFHSRRYGARASVGRPLGKRSNISLTYRYENARLSHVLTSILPADFDPKVRSLTVSLKDDRRDDPFNTTKGTFVQWDNEFAGAFLSGTNTFVRSTLRLKGFHAFNTETVLGSSLDIGWMQAFGSSSDVPINERFFAGGPMALRAFEYQRIGPVDDFYTALGGKFKIIWNLAELRRTIYKFIGAAAFIDVGQVWSDIRMFRLRDIRIAIGPGIRVNTPIGMLRLDWGINLFPQEHEGKSQLFFNMGQAF